MTRLGWVAIIVIACGHAAPPVPPPTPKPVAIDAGVVAIDAPKPLDEDLPRLAERGVAHFAAWARTLADAGEDCAAATAKLNALADQNADVIAANTKIIRAGRDKVKALREALAPYDEQLGASAKAIAESPTMRACHDNAAFARATDRVGGEP